MKDTSSKVLLALMFTMAQIVPALATIDNTVTVNADGPGGAIPPVTATENVDVADDVPLISINKTHTFAPGGDLNNNGLVDAGDIVRFSYVVANTGNVTLSNVVADDTVFQGTGTTPTIVVPVVFTDGGQPGGSSDPVTGDGDWDLLGPGDSITFTSDYTVVAGDLVIPGNLDNDLDTTGRATGNYDPGTGNVVVTATDPEPVPLNVAPSLSVSKVASPDTNVAAGTVVTYTYTVTNTGTVPLTNVTLTDNVTAGSGADPVPTFSSWTAQAGSTVAGNTLTLFNPGAVAVFTGTYTVTQSDVDTLQ